MATVESLSEGGQSLRWDLPGEFLERGTASHTFKLPVRSEPSHYGFFLCTAARFDSSCKNKTVRDINEVFTEHIRQKPRAGTELRTLFFQYMILDERGLAAFSHFKNENKNFEELKKYMKDRKLRSKQLEGEIEDVKKNMNTLFSYPLKFTGQKIKVELPKYNISSCGQKEK
jgi:hypothetical protein